MSELSLFVYIKSHVTLHLKSNAEKVNSKFIQIREERGFPSNIRKIGFSPGTRWFVLKHTLHALHKICTDIWARYLDIFLRKKNRHSQQDNASKRSKGQFDSF